MLKYVLLIIGFLFFLQCKTKESTAIAPKFNLNLSDEETALLDQVQRQTFNYFWKGGEPISGAARERIHTDGIYPHDDAEIVTSGGTGFGIMATLAGIERGFITRQEGFQRLNQLTNWLAKAERFHGAWAHWMHPDGKAKPFSKMDDGGDLVETAFLVQGLLTARQYFQNGNKAEKELAEKMDQLWKEVDWKWYTQGENVLYWHWSPNYKFKKDFAVKGYNECLIMYVLAASSPTHPAPAAAYHEGFMRGGDIKTDREYYGLPTILDYYDSNDMAVGPMFWSHYSYLGLDPRGLSDQYGDFWKLTKNHAKIMHRHCATNPYEYEGYSEKCWGLTSSYSMKGYAGHNPQEDFGVITPTAALASFPYTPKESMDFLKFMYQEQDTLIGEYGPYDAFSFQSDWYLPRYLAIDQLPIPVMIENYRSGLLWQLFMSAPEIQSGLKELGFTYQAMTKK